jgi:hypothetical protein
MVSARNSDGFRPRHLTVRIPPSQGGYTGSIPVEATKFSPHGETLVKRGVLMGTEKSLKPA